MKILFFPSDRGGGFGHLSRCISLALEAEARGHLCAFVLSDIKYEKRIKAQFPVFMAKSWLPWFARTYGALHKILRTKNAPEPLYIGISGLDFQVVRDGLVTEKSIQYMLDSYRSAVRTFRPDIIVGDTNLLVWMLSREVALPVVQVVRYATHPQTAKLIWWENVSNDITPPNSSTLFNLLLEKTALEPISKAEDLLKGDLYIVPSIPELEPINGHDHTEHVGELLVPINTETIGPWSDWLTGSTPIVYITIGGGSGPVGNKLFFSSIIEAFSDSPIRVIVSTGGKYTIDAHPPLPPNVRFFNWVPGRQMIARADLVIFHGGYATMMETIACGKPALIIPFQSEQEGNGRRLEQFGCGRVLKLSNGPFEQVNATCHFGEYSYIVQRRYDLTSSKLISTVRETLNDPGYSVKAQALQKKVVSYGGPSRAVDIIEHFLGPGH